MLTKQSVLSYWRKTLCRPVPLHFDGEVQMGKLLGYKFRLREDVFDRSKNKSADCYKGPNLPDGLSDLSKCFYGSYEWWLFSQHLKQLWNKILTDQPIVASFPHFLGRSGNFTQKLKGIRPNRAKHESFSIIEPVLGVPLNQRATSQSNIVIGDLSEFKPDIARFSNMVIPMFWISVTVREKKSMITVWLGFLNIDFLQMEKITPLIIDTVDFIVNTLPKIQNWISGGSIVTGLCLVLMGYLQLR